MLAAVIASFAVVKPQPCSSPWSLVADGAICEDLQTLSAICHRLCLLALAALLVGGCLVVRGLCEYGESGRVELLSMVVAMVSVSEIISFALSDVHHTHNIYLASHSSHGPRR